MCYINLHLHYITYVPLRCNDLCLCFDTCLLVKKNSYLLVLKISDDHVAKHIWIADVGRAKNNYYLSRLFYVIT